MVELERTTINYFAYGSNLDLDEMLKYTRIVGVPLRGELENFVIEFNKQSYKDPTKGFANIVPQWGGKTEGMIYRMRKSDLESLDKKEGFPEHYQKIKLPISCTHSSGYSYVLDCIVYIANFWRQKRGLVVSEKYRDKISRGAESLSEDYRESLLKKMV